MSTCRFCRERDPGANVIKYGLRHYAHPQCLLDAKGGALGFVPLLHLWQLDQLPWDFVKKNHLGPFIEGKRVEERARMIAERERVITSALDRDWRDVAVGR